MFPANFKALSYRDFMQYRYDSAKVWLLNFNHRRPGKYLISMNALERYVSNSYSYASHS